MSTLPLSPRLSQSWRSSRSWRSAGIALALGAAALAGPRADANTYGMQTSAYNDRPLLQGTIQNYAAANIDITEMATTPSGDWIVVAGNTAVASAGFPSSCLAKVNEYLSKNLEIDAIAFAPNGAWFVIAEHLAWHSASVPDVVKLEEKVLERINAGKRLTELAFDSDGSGWTLISGDWAYSLKIPSDIYAAIVERHASKRAIRQVEIAPDGRWLLLADDWFASDGLNTTCVNWLRTFQRNEWSLDRVMLGLGGNWVLFSNGAFVPDLTPGVEALEYGIAHDGTTSNIWERMNDLKIAGCSIAIVEGNDVKWARGYGELEAGTQRFVRSTSPFDAASCSKFVASAALMTLVDDPAVPLGLDSSVADVIIAGWQQGNPLWTTLFTWLYYGPSFYSWYALLPYNDITLRRCLSNSASLVPHSSTAYLPGDPAPATVQMLFGHSCSGGACGNYGGGNMVWYEPFLLEDGQPHPPGTVYKYSGGGFLVGQAMGEELTGKKLAQFAQERLFDPIGLKNATFEAPLPASFLDRAAVPHDSNGVAKAPAARPYYPWSAAGGLWASASDMAEIIIMLNKTGVASNGVKVMEPATALEMMKDQAPGSAKYGFGLSLASNTVSPAHDSYFAHNGSHSGAKARIGGHPKQQQAIVVLVNGGGDDAATFREELYTTFKNVYGW